VSSIFYSKCIRFNIKSYLNFLHDVIILLCGFTSTMVSSYYCTTLCSSHEAMDSYKIWLGQWRNCHTIFVDMATRFMAPTRYPFMHWFYAQFYIPLLKSNIPWKNSSVFFTRICSFRKIFFEIFNISRKIWFVLKPPTYYGVRFERQINLWCNKWINSSFGVVYNNGYYSC
jgi:hypothetical protein